MAATPTTPAVAREREVIDAAGATCAAIADLEIRKLILATEWVALHPGDEVDTSIEWGMRDLEIAGDGAPRSTRARSRSSPSPSACPLTPVATTSGTRSS